MGINSNFLSFNEGKISKADYIKKNYEDSFEPMFEISDFLKKSDIKKIELQNGEVIATWKQGFSLLCEKQEYRTAPLETLNFLSYEKEEVNMFLQLLRGKKTLFDIGGNIGYYAIHSAWAMPELKVHSFEPSPDTFQVLLKNINLNSLSNRIKAHEIGFSDKNEEISFYRYPFGGTNASMINVSNSSTAKKTTIKVIKLDDFVLNNERPDIIKCDVEGAEKLVLDGGINFIKEAKPVIFFELLRKWSAPYGYHPNEVVTIMRQIGYSCYISQNGSLKPIELINDDTIETNFFFIHGNK